MRGEIDRSSTLMHLPGQVDDIVRGVAMHYILERLGVDYHDENNMPEVVVFVISGPTPGDPYRPGGRGVLGNAVGQTGQR